MLNSLRTALYVRYQVGIDVVHTSGCREQVAARR